MTITDKDVETFCIFTWCDSDFGVFKSGSVFLSSSRVVDGARTDDDEESVTLAEDDVGSILTALDNGVGGLLGERDFGGEKLGRDQRILSEDWSMLVNGLDVSVYEFGSGRTATMRNGCPLISQYDADKLAHERHRHIVS